MLLNKYVMTAAIAAVFAVPAFAADTLSAKDVQAATALRDAARTGNLSYRILESLTTEVGPRMAGSANDARAVAWAEAKFKELGFDKVWKEPVTFPVWKRGVETAEIVAPFPQPMLVTALGGSVATPADGVSADVVSFPTLKELVAAPDDAVRGKIVFIDHKMQKASDYGSVQAAAARARRKRQGKARWR